MLLWLSERVGRGRPRPGRPSWLNTGLVFVIAGSVLAILLKLASISLIAAVAAIGFAALLAVLFSMGVVETATGLIVLAMFFAPLNDVRPSSAVSFVTAADLLFVLGFGLLSPVIVFRRIVAPTFFVLGSMILVATGIFASIAGTDPSGSINAMTRLVVAALGLPVVFMLWRPEKRTVAWLAGAYLAGQTFSVFYALAEGPSANGRYDGLGTHTNFFGLSALLAVSLVPYVSTFARHSRRWIPWAAGLVCLYGIWISGSRAALVVFLLLVLVYPALERSVMAAGVVMAAGAVFLLEYNRIFQSGGDNALSRLRGDSSSAYSDLQRQRLITEGFKSFHDRPFLGRGFANALESHNIYLEIAVGVGLIGTVGYLFIIGSAVSPLFTVPKPFNQLAYPAFAYAAVGLLTNALWDRFIWAALSLSLIARLLADDETPPDEDSSAQERPMPRRSVSEDRDVAEELV